jgi:hypothetical protein
MSKFPEKENPAESSNAGTHEVPCTKESGCAEHLDKVNREFAEKCYREEESRINESFDNSHERLENAGDIAHGVSKEHSGYESDALTPKKPVFDDAGHTRYEDK